MGAEQRGRILCVTSNFPRWKDDSTTPFVLHLARDLQGLGWTVDVLAPHAPGAVLNETVAGVHVERFRYFWPEAGESVCYQGGALVNLRRRRLDYLKLPPLVLFEWASLARRLHSGRYDLVHSHWILPQGFTATLAAGPSRTPHVATVHGSDVLALNGPLLNRFKRFALRRADAVTANSSATRDAAIGLAPDIRNLQTVPMGVSMPREPDMGAVAALRARYRRGRGPLLIFVGRVVLEKGVEDLIDAVRQLMPRLPDITALIVGDGQDRSMIEARAGAMGVGDRVTFAGWMSPEALPDYLAAGDMFVGPSWIEAQGLIFAEAMLAGTPVIASDVGGVRDTVRDNETGILVPARASAEIARAVERLHGNEALSQSLAAAGRTYARHHCTGAQTANAFSRIFDGILLRRGRRSSTAASVTVEHEVP